MRKFLPCFILFCGLICSSGVNAQCNSGFTFSANQSVVNFTGASNSNNFSHTWTFGDGTSGHGSTISHTYSQPGQYSVKHIVVDSFNTCRDSSLQLITVNFVATCAASFYFVPDSSVSNRFKFYANTTPGLQGIQSYLWKVDGATVSSASTFSYTFLPGSHAVCLSITTSAGCSATSCQTVSIWPRCTWNPSFTYTASSTNAQQISFSPLPSQPTLQYLWNFGDGSSSNVKNPVHAFVQAGTYNVKLSVYDTVLSCSDTVRQNVTVNGAPANICTASFIYSRDSTHPSQYSFTAVSNQTIASQLWTIGHFPDTLHSVQLSANNPVYNFTDTGRYIVCLTITTNTGCRASTCNTVIINNIAGGRQSGVIPSYPNPAINSVSLGVYLDQEKRLVINIYNLSGNVVYSSEKQGTAGNNIVTIPVQSLKKGQYFVEIQYGDQRKRSIFQKL